MKKFLMPVASKLFVLLFSFLQQNLNFPYEIFSTQNWLRNFKLKYFHFKQQWKKFFHCQGHNNSFNCEFHFCFSLFQCPIIQQVFISEHSATESILLNKKPLTVDKLFPSTICYATRHFIFIFIHFSFHSHRIYFAIFYFCFVNAAFLFR
jgi:hypothetical protein